jgi:NADPH:quinone reductase-like Zn-dependent oxidoreductase
VRIYRSSSCRVQSPGADEVLVEVEAVPLNFRDSLIMENRLGWRAPSGWSTG